MKRSFLTLIITFFMVALYAQGITISGRITNESDSKLPFASLYIQNTTIGTTANENGFYSLTADSIRGSLIIKQIGYYPVIIPLQSFYRDTILNVVLKQQSFQFDIGNTTNFSAERIIRKAIKKRNLHRQEIDGYGVNVYMKGLEKLTDAPRKILGRNLAEILNLDSVGKGVLFFAESESKLYFNQPDRFREVMLASKVSGKNESFGFNKATDLTVDFYKNQLQFDELSIRGFVSPLADYASFYYRYKLTGTNVSETGQTVYKIEVIPRRKHDPVFSGFIYLTDNDWRLYSVDLYITKNANINLADTVRFKQQFIPIGEKWLPASIQLSFNGRVLGFSFEGFFLNVYRNYNLNPKLSEHFFTGETFKVTKDVINKNEQYWQSRRPVPLTNEQRLSYRKRDADAEIIDSRAFRDSVTREKNRFSLVKIGISGYTITDKSTSRSVSFAPILPAIFYNTVEGFGFKYQITYKKVYNLKNFIDISPQVRYGFSNKHINPTIEARYYYDPVNKGFLSFKIGSDVRDITNLRPSTTISNSINTLIYEYNRTKVYEKQLVNFGGNYEVKPGLFGTTSIEYSKRRTLSNTSGFRIIDWPNRRFSPNNPFSATEDLFTKHDALVFSAEVDYAPFPKYITRPEGKFYQSSKYPRFVLTYKKGFKTLLGSDVDFDFASFEIYQNNIKLGLLGQSSYTIKSGKFFNNAAIQYPDFYHFRGNASLIFEGSLRNFHYLDIFGYSTKDQFFEAHYQHNFGSFIMNKIPVVRKLKLEEILGVAYLAQPGTKRYREFFFGLQRLVVRVDYALAYSYGKKVYQGFKISYGLK